MTKDPILTGLISGKDIIKARPARKASDLFQTVRKSHVAANEADGWSVVRVNKSTVRMNKRKPLGQALEDELWVLMASMGFDDMNASRDFCIPVAQDGASIPPRQVDVFAKDECAAIIIECKHATSPSKKSMQKEVAELSNSRSNLIKSVHRHYGRDSKLKAGTIMATRNIQWSENDLERARAAQIHILRDDDLDYYRELADHIGYAARYQLLADVFAGQKIPGLELAVPALRGKMGGRTLYSFVIEPAHLLRIAFVSHRAKIDRELIVSYQRMLKKKRLKEIAEFINQKGIFPTNIVINLRSKSPVRFDKKSDEDKLGAVFGLLHLPCTYKSAWVVDGQHRLYGFAGTEWASKATIPVIAFENMDASDEAKMFVSINHEQVKVPKNLLVELAADLYWNSDRDEDQLYALTSKIASSLGSDILSPLRGRMAAEGKKQSHERPITLTAMYEAIKRSGLLGTVIKGRLHPGALYDYDGPSSLRRATEVYAGYLQHFSSMLPDHWALGSHEGGYLCTNNGITALFMLLSAVIDYLERFAREKPKELSPDELLQHIKPFIDPVVDHFSQATFTEFKSLRRLQGSGGQRNAAFEMMELVRAQKSTFDPDGLDDYVQSKNTVGTDQARVLMPEIQLAIQGLTLRLLREELNQDQDSWWRDGVPAPIRIEVAGRREASPEIGELEDFFELIDYKKIASARWLLFQKYFAMGSERSKENQLAWFDRLNGIRNRIAHPERGPIKDDELDFLREVKDHLEQVGSLYSEEYTIT